MTRRPRERSREKPKRPSRQTRERQKRRERPQRVALDRRSISPEKPRDNNVDAIKTSLQSSLESTDAGLKRFLDSVKQSGLEQVIQDYRSLQGVLLQQRRWAHNNNAEGLLSLFESIGHTADDLHRIFAAYADIMRPLKQLGNLVPPSLPVAAGLAREADASADAAPVSAPDTQPTGDQQQEPALAEMSGASTQVADVGAPQVADVDALAANLDETDARAEPVAPDSEEEGTAPVEPTGE